MNKQKILHIAGLDSLRFILAMIVLLSHLQNPFVPYFKGFNNVFLNALAIIINHLFCGTGAVIAFFVISGFVIHYPHKNENKINAYKFLIKRWIRIGIPLLFIIILSTYYGEFKQMPIWSIFCELIYYTLYPLLRKIKLKWNYLFYFSFFLAIIANTVLNYQNILSFVHHSNINYHGTYACNGPYLTWIIGLPCWLLGVVLAENIDFRKNDVTFFKLFLFRCIVFLVSILFFVLESHFHLSYVLSMNFFALLIYFWLQKEILYYSNNKPNATLEYLGTFSYSLFICHKLIFILFLMFSVLNIYNYIVYIFVALFVSYIYYLIIESPAHRLGRFLGR